MKTLSGLLSVVAVAGLVIASPVLAKTAKSGTPKVTCKQINAAVASGKSADDVATELNVSPERVKSCGTPSAKQHHHHTTPQKKGS
jgi:hypothetical protein